MRCALGSADPPIQQVVESGVVPKLSKLLDSPNSDIRLEAAWCLTNVATGNHEQTGATLLAVPNMIQILLSERDSGECELQEQICWAIGNIAGDSDDYRSILLANGCLNAVLHLLRMNAPQLAGLLHSKGQTNLTTACLDDPRQSQLVATVKTASWTLSNLARGSIPATPFLDTGASWRIPLAYDTA